MENSNIEKYVTLLKDMINFAVQPLDCPAKIKKRLKYQKDSDWAFQCHSFDVIEDTELAKANFYKFHLSGPTKYDDDGEKYLRLYGILNAIYLQRQAICKLGTLFQVDDKNKKEKRIKKLQISELRNKIGAHATDYRKESSTVTTSYSINRCSLNMAALIINDEQDRYDLEKLIQEYDFEIEKYFYVIVDTAIKRIFKDSQKDAEQFKNKLHDIYYRRVYLNGKKICIQRYDGV